MSRKEAEQPRGRAPLRSRIARRYRLINQELYLDLNDDEDRCAIVLGSGRGGTTWIAEQLARQSRSRMLFEPFHPRWSPVREQVPLFLQPDNDDPEALDAVRRVLRGHVRKRQIDQVLAARLPRSRVVKDIHTPNLTPWFRVQFPSTPIVFVVRHPISTSLSRLKAGSFYGVAAYLETPAGRQRAEESPVAPFLRLYDESRESDEPLIRQVAEWCIENAYPLTFVGKDAGIRLAYYESIVLDGAEELEGLSEFCQGALGKGAGLRADDMRRPSAMDWNGTAAATTTSSGWEARLARWTDEVDEGLAVECMDLVGEFGIDLDYDTGALPTVERSPSR